MELNYRELEHSHRGMAPGPENRSIFYMDEMPGLPYDYSPSSDIMPEVHHYRLCDSADILPIAASIKTPKRRRNSSLSSQCVGGNVNGTGRARRQRRPSECLEHPARRNSSCHSGANRSRSHSCARPTPLGDGRRASVCKRSSISRSRRPSSARRRDSIRPTRSISEGGGRFSATSLEGPKKESREAELARRRHRRITTILLATFFFILAASVFAVVVTLTHSSFHRPPIGSKELADHRANDGVNMPNETAFRKENEELLNSLNRDTSTPANGTLPL